MEHDSWCDYDIAVIGGGINGAGIARDAAGRGLRVLLVEQGDLAQATSSGSTKLIHGGLRYLEFFEFNLVHQALKERDVLLHIAPHIIWPLTFVLPYQSGLKPRWMIRLGLWLYDRLGSGRSILPKSKRLDLPKHPMRNLLRPAITSAFSYADCWVQDARLVVLNAMDAQQHGATIRTHTRCVDGGRIGEGWRLTLEDANGAHNEITTEVVVNAAGPWVAEVLEKVLLRDDVTPIRKVKGSHIVVPRLYDGDEAMILPQADGRIVFTIPYEGEFTLIGTTEEKYEDDPLKAEISEQEINYLCEAVSGYLALSVTPEQVVWSYAAVRPLVEHASDDNRSASRDYKLILDTDGGKAPLLSVYGGKITTYRVLAQEAVDRLAPWLKEQESSGHWTHLVVLPGGGIVGGNVAAYHEELCVKFPWLPQELVRRFIRHYGTNTPILIGEAKSLEDMGADYGAGLYEAEIAYLIANEYARSAEDILWRRTKLGLHMSAEQREAVRARLGQ